MNAHTSTSSERIHLDAFNLSQDAILLIQGERFIDCNPAAVNMLQAMDRSEVLDTHPADLSPERQPDGRLSGDKASEMISQALQTGFHRFEWRHRRMNGEVFPCEVTLSAIESGEQTLLHVTWRDLTEEKAAQRRLQFLEAAGQQSSNGIATSSLNGVIRTTNEAWAQMHGYSTDELHGRHISLFHTRQQMEREVAPLMEKVLALGAFSGEVGHVRKNGEQFPTWMTVAPVKDDEGKPIGLISSAHDISERKARERQLQESERRYRTLFELAPNAIVIIDLQDGSFIQFNRQAHENLGYTRQEFQRLKVQDIEVVESPEQALVHLQQIMQEGHDTFETRHRRKDGEIRDMEVICQLIEIEGRQFKQSIWRDITEQKKSDQALRQEIQRRTSLSNLLEISLHSRNQEGLLQDFLHELLDQPIMRIRNQGAIFLADREQQRLHMVAAHNLEQCVVKHCSQVAFSHCLCGRVARDGTPIYATTNEDPRHDVLFKELNPHGHYIIPVVGDRQLLGVINLYLEPEVEYDHTDIDYLSAAADILAGALYRLRAETELQQYSQHLEQIVEERTRKLALAAAKAEEANLAKSRFLANMSHELRTPMHAILSFSRLGMQRLSEVSLEKLGSYFTHVDESGSRLLHLLDDLLDLAKLEADRMTMDCAEADLQQIVDQCVADQKARLEEQGLTLEVIPATCETTGRFDALRITQVVNNLLGNAIKFTPSGKRIWIAISSSSLRWGRRKSDNERRPALRLSLRDEGIGIPDDELETVFDKFIQSSKTRSAGGGTGLGLAICKEIIEAHRGRIWAQNHPLGGAEFLFEIPFEAVVSGK